MEFRMVTHVQGSTVSNLKIQCMTVHFSVNKVNAAEAHRILVETYGDNALSDTTCRDLFRRFKNNYFKLEDKERSGAPKKFEYKELEKYSMKTDLRR